jgi:hypothetical protein
MQVAIVAIMRRGGVLVMPWSFFFLEARVAANSKTLKRLEQLRELKISPKERNKGIIRKFKAAGGKIIRIMQEQQTQPA